MLLGQPCPEGRGVPAAPGGQRALPVAAAPGRVGGGLAVPEQPEVANGGSLAAACPHGAPTVAPGGGVRTGRPARLGLDLAAALRGPGPGSARRRTRGRRPTGRPLAIRVTGEPHRLQQAGQVHGGGLALEVGLVQRITSVMPSSSTRTSSSRTRSWSGPMPSIGLRAPWSTW